MVFQLNNKYFATIFVVVSLVYSTTIGQANNYDVELVKGTIVELDSILPYHYISRAGVRYYYDTFHLKIETEKNDVLILTYVYNVLEQANDAYQNRFGLKIGEEYIFHLTRFVPCKNYDFTNLRGNCTDQVYKPKNNSIMKKYKSIQRILYFSK